MKFYLGYITTNNRQEAEKISNVLVEEKLVECVNIIDQVKSVFWWQGEIEKSKECLMLIKTKKSLAKKIIIRVRSLHSYQCPCIIFFPIEMGDQDYLKYIEKSTI